MAAAAISFGAAELAHGSGFLAVYLTGLALGTGIIPAHRTVTAFHQGLSWVAQISLFFMLGLLVFPSQLGEVAVEGVALALLLIFVAAVVIAIAAVVGEPGRATIQWLGWRMDLTAVAAIVLVLLGALVALVFWRTFA